MRYLIPVIQLVAAIGIVSAQTPSQSSDGPLPAFEVASVRANKNGPIGPMMMRTLPTRVEATNVPVRLLLLQAFRLPNFQIQGGPSWLDSDRFDIAAKPPDGTPPDQLPLMMRSLLVERFKLATHRETRDAPIYALVLARADGKLGPKLTKTTDDCDAILAERKASARARGPGPVPFTPPGPNERPVCTVNTLPVSRTPGAPFVLRLRAGGQTMEFLARNLSGAVNRPVIDRTGLMGLYDYEVEFAPGRTLNTAPLTVPPGGPASSAGGPVPSAPIDDGPSVFESVQQLGLKLESTKGPVEYLVIDSVEKPVDD
jgi:uncharacterized protein (TIGR03435 family)